MRGYPAWPAKVVEKRSDGKFAIIFYGTLETANVQPADIWPHDTPNTTKFCTEKNLKRSLFMEGMEQMKQALAKDDSKAENFVMDQDEEDMVKEGRSASKEADDYLQGSSKGLKRKPMGAQEGRGKRTRKLTSKMLESPLIKKVKERTSEGFDVEMEGMRSKRKGESEAVVDASKKNRKVAIEKTPPGTAFGELKDMGPGKNSLRGKDTKQSRSWSLEERVEGAGHLDGGSEASLMSIPPLPMETAALCYPEAEPSSLKDWLQVAGHGQ